jgi:protein-disulfide isomerase
MIRLLAFLAILLAGTPAIAQHSSPQAGPRSFSEAQRREIVDIIREALKQDPSILRDAVGALQADDSDREQGATRAAIAASRDELLRNPGDPIEGNPNGDVTIVEFYDVRCPYCRRMLPTMAEALKRDRNLRVVYKDIPILGPGSVIAARAVLAAQRQGGYLKLREALMTGPPQIDSDVVKATAQRLGLDWDRLQRDMADPAIQARIDANLRLAHVLNIQGTPAYVVGETMLPGALSLADLQDVVAQTRRR